MLSWLGLKKPSLNGVVPKLPVPDKDDDRWECVGHVKYLNLYPMKSCRANRLQSAKVEIYGLCDDYGNRDRQFMVVNSKNIIVTGRQQTKLVLVQVSVVPGFQQVKFSAPDMEDIFVDLPNTNDDSSMIHVEVFGDHTTGYDMGPDISEWLSRYLNRPSGSGYRVIFHPFHSDSRPAANARRNERVTASNMGPEDTCLYADVAAFMACTTASVEGLNQKLQGRTEVDPFFCRPNIVIDNGGGPAFDEDQWVFIKIGDTAVFRIINWSDRCIFTTIDPYTAIKNPKMEPLRTLRSFRCWRDVAGDSPFFGVNLSIDNPVGCTIKVEDDVHIIRMTKCNEVGDSNAKKLVLTAVTIASVISMAVLIVKKYN